MLEFTKRIKKSCLAKIVRQIKFKKELKKHKRTKEKYHSRSPLRHGIFLLP